MTHELTGRRWPPLPRAGDRLSVMNALNSRTWTDGEYTLAVEHRMREITGAEYCVAFNSCTSALHAVLAADHRASVNGKIYTTPLTFVGTVTGAGHLGYDLEYVDVDPHTLTADPASPDQRTVYDGLFLAVDLHGVPHDLLRDNVVTDACQAFGTHVNGRHIGHEGTHCWSFSSAKTIAAPDGGAVTTNDQRLARHLQMLRDYGAAETMHPGRANGLVHHRRGHNWRPSELTMALVDARLETYADRPDEDPVTGARGQHIAARLQRAAAAAGLWHQTAPSGTVPAWHKIRIGPRGWHEDDSARLDTARLQAQLHRADVPTHVWGRFPLHLQPAYRDHRGPSYRFPIAERASTSTFSLGTEQCPPWTWTDEEVDQVCHVIASLKASTTV